ncbi:MAG: putative RNA methyltransferase [Oscillibacter sp.]
MVNLRCPVCAGALEKRAGAYLCPKNHSFDIAKSGYVNLPAQLLAGPPRG